MDKIRLGIGRLWRHGYATSLRAARADAQTPFNNVELCALCDIRRRENAELAAGEAEKLLGVQTGNLH